ncbi:MAG: hypothetical protein H7A35_10295 [Planctomycetales bacterium]|nr:hypothetical protein [bacterium]UNM07260.1 MAG: hypothetical protein H7A35_10295 [Planctomycetales bacterium]
MGTVPLSARLFPFIALLLLGFCLAIILMLDSMPDPQLLASAVAVDITLTLSLAWFLMVARPMRLPLVNTLVFFVATVLVAESLLPAEGRGVLGWISLLAVPAELALVWAALNSVRGFLKALRSGREGDARRLDMLMAFHQSMEAVAGRSVVSRILASELAMLYYAFSPTLKDEDLVLGDGRFSYNRLNDYQSLVLSISILMLFEMVGVHLLVHHFWGAWPAWIITGLSFYGFLWLRADSVASIRRPIEVREEGLLLRCGLRWTVEVPWQQIAGIEFFDPEQAELPAGTLRMLLNGKGNCLLRLGDAVNVEGSYGIRRRASVLYLSVDELPAFSESLSRACAEQA